MSTPSNPAGLPPATISSMMAGAQLTKGRIVLPTSRASHEFMFNPTEVKTGHGWEWGKHSPPGMSHKVLSGGVGTDEMISFKLIVDGDRGRASKRRGGDAGGVNGTGFDVSDELNFFRSLTFPTQPVAARNGSYVTGGSPPSFVLSLGTMFTKTECVAETIEIEVTAFTPQLEPLRATIEIKLWVVARAPVYQSDIYESADAAIEQGICATYQMAGLL